MLVSGALSAEEGLDPSFQVAQIDSLAPLPLQEMSRVPGQIDVGSETQLESTWFKPGLLS